MKDRYYIAAVSMGAEGIERETLKGVGPFADSPEKAVEKWCRYSQAYPTCTAIQPKTKEDGMSLLKWAAANEAAVRELLQRYKTPYRADWIMETVRRYASEGRTPMQWDGDQIYPFSMG